MKSVRNLLVAMVLLLVPTLIMANDAIDSPRGAEITFTTKVIDLGRLSREDDKQVVRLAFTNTGDVPLIVNQVRTSCTCVTVRCDDRKVHPGDSGAMVITFDPSKAPEGSLYRVLQVDTTARGGVQHITLTAEIE